MAIDTSIPRSPGWWLDVLARELQNRRWGRDGGRRWNRHASTSQRLRPPLELLHDYLEGDPPLRAAAKGWEDNFREVIRIGRLNLAAMSIESKSNRMKLVAVRTSAPDDLQGDQAAQQMMRANNMPVLARDVHDGMLSLADSYVMVTPPASEGDYSLFTAEDAREVITAHDPATGRTLAGLKMFRDEWDAADFAYLFVREDAQVKKYVATKPRGLSIIRDTPFRLSPKGWDWVDEEYGRPVPAGRMPIVRFRNYRSRGEYEPHLETLDRINEKIIDTLVISKVQAFRQRAIKGLPDKTTKIVDGVRVEEAIDYSDVFAASPGSLWQVPANVDFWESQPVDLGPIRMSIKDDLEHFAAVTSTSLHTITPDAASGSAEGASLMRESSVDAALCRIDHADRSWAEVIATGFAFMGDDARSDPTGVEPIWGPTERYSLAEKADAASKASTSLPVEAIQTDIWQYPPAEIPNLQAMRGRDVLFQIPDLSRGA